MIDLFVNLGFNLVICWLMSILTKCDSHAAPVSILRLSRLLFELVEADVLRSLVDFFVIDANETLSHSSLCSVLVIDDHAAAGACSAVFIHCDTDNISPWRAGFTWLVARLPQLICVKHVLVWSYPIPVEADEVSSVRKVWFSPYYFKTILRSKFVVVKS